MDQPTDVSRIGIVRTPYVEAPENPNRRFLRILATVFVYFYFALAVFLHFATQATGRFDYAEQEWFISYRFGFLRRGLIGSILEALERLFHADQFPVLVIVTGAIATICLFLFERLIRKQRSWISPTLAILIALMPASLAYYLGVNADTFPRTDLLILVFTLVHASLLKLEDEKYLLYSAILFCLLGPAIVLCKESFLFLGLPVNLLLFWLRVPRKPLLSALVLAPALLATAIVTVKHGTPAQVSTLKAFNTAFQTKYTPLAFMSVSLKEELKIVLATITFHNLELLLVVGTALVLGCFWYLKEVFKFAKFDLGLTWSSLVRTFLLLPLLLSLPIYLAGIDWGRWVTLVFSCFVAILFGLVKSSDYRVKIKPLAFIPLILLEILLTVPSYLGAKTYLSTYGTATISNLTR